MELTALYQRVIGLDVHQAKITACAFSPTPAFGSMSWSPISTGRRHAP